MAKTSSTFRLMLIRCAQTEWDAAGRLQGGADLPLSEQGRAWAGGMGERLASDEDALPRPDLILHAPDEASTETAKLIAEPTKARAKETADLGAMSLGLWEGLRREELGERHPKNFGQWQSDPASINPPEGDSYTSVQTRLLGAIARVAEKHPKKRVAIVLRPIEFEITRRALSALTNDSGTGPMDSFWPKPDEASTIELFTINPSDLQQLLGQTKASA
ncbi:MAG: histidine phosphatase family protein [Phycisphaerales bacterium JB065]